MNTKRPFLLYLIIVHALSVSAAGAEQLSMQAGRLTTTHNELGTMGGVRIVAFSPFLGKIATGLGLGVYTSTTRFTGTVVRGFIFPSLHTAEPVQSDNHLMIAEILFDYPLRKTDRMEAVLGAGLGTHWIEAQRTGGETGQIARVHDQKLGVSMALKLGVSLAPQVPFGLELGCRYRRIGIVEIIKIDGDNTLSSPFGGFELNLGLSYPF